MSLLGARSTRSSIGFVAVAVLALAGCGEQTGAGGEGEDDLQPITPRAIGVIMIDHLDVEVDRIDSDGDFGDVTAELRYGSDGEYDGDLVGAGVGEPGFGEVESDDICADLDPCEQLELPDGAEGEAYLTWELEAFESDPGNVIVIVNRDADTATFAIAAGERISGDPRDLDLTVSVDDLLAIATDPRLDQRTPASVIEAGEQLDEFVD